MISNSKFLNLNLFIPNNQKNNDYYYNIFKKIKIIKYMKILLFKKT